MDENHPENYILTAGHQPHKWPYELCRDIELKDKKDLHS